MFDRPKPTVGCSANGEEEEEEEDMNSIIYLLSCLYMLKLVFMHCM
jgi:hypothetical protein